MDLTTGVIKELFNDVNNFLANTLSTETLSKHAEKQREALVQRLACHLPASSSSSNYTLKTYIDMNGTTKGIAHEEVYMDVSQGNIDESEPYEEFPDQQPHSSQSLSIEDNSQTKITNMDKVMMSVSKLQEISKKYGPLYRKEKVLFIDHLIRCWAGITADDMLIYKSEKETKPSSVLNIIGYEARPAPFYYLKDTKKRDSCFEIVCPGKKSYQFIARTAKDMEQWVASINTRQRDSSKINVHLSEEPVINQVSLLTSAKRSLPAPPKDSNNSETCDEYDDVSTLVRHNVYDDEDIYHDISDIIHNLHTPFEEEDIPLPPRRPVPKPTKEDTSDNDSVYDDVGFINPDNVYYNVPGQSPGTPSTPGQRSVTGPLKGERTGIEVISENNPVEKCVYDNSEEDIYDDIGGSEKPPESTRIVLRHDSTNSRRIHHLIRKMESFGTGKENNFGHRIKSASIPSSTSEELYELIDAPEESNGDIEFNMTIPKRTREVHL